MSKEIMDLKELGEYLSFSHKKIYNLVKEDKIPYSRIGHQYRFIKDEINAWLKNQKGKPETMISHHSSKKDDFTISLEMSKRRYEDWIKTGKLKIVGERKYKIEI